MTDTFKSWNGGSSSLWFAMQAEKGLPKSATRFASTKSNGKYLYVYECFLYQILSNMTVQHKSTRVLKVCRVPQWSYSLFKDVFLKGEISMAM